MLKNYVIYISALFIVAIAIPLALQQSQQPQDIIQRAAAIDPTSGTTQPIGQTGSWKLIFSDEFNGTTVDATKWTRNWQGSSETITTKPINDQESACYDPQQATVTNGELNLNAVQRICQIWDNASGIVHSNGKFSFAYGYMEARMWMPEGTGVKPAFGSIGQNLPTDGKIGIVEAYGDDRSTFNYYYSCVGSGECSPGGETNVVGATTGWHTYAAHWEPGKITWYYDGQKVFEQISAVVASEHYLIANLGIVSNNAAIPNKLRVDYIRVWQKGAGANVTAVPTQIGPTLITPTIHCVGGSAVPPCATMAPTNTVPGGGGGGAVTPGTTTPPIGGVNPTGGTNPTPNIAPCTTDSSASVMHNKKHKKHKKFKGGSGGGEEGGFIEIFFKFLMKLIEWLISGGGQMPPINPNPGTTPTPDPTTSPCPEPTSETPTQTPTMPSEPAPTIGSIATPTLFGQPTTNPTPGTANPVPSSPPVAVGATVLFASDFNSGTIAPWSTIRHCPPLSEGAVVSDSVREGGFAFKVRVKGGGCDPIHRADLTTTNPAVVVREGDERWYQWSMRFADNFTYPQGTRNYFNILKWTDTNDSAPLKVSVANNGFVQISGQGSTTPQNITTVKKGQWIDYVVHIKFSSNNSVGFVEAWQNGIQSVPKTNRVTFSGASQAFTFGLDRDDANIDIEHEIWFDALKITAP